MADVSKAAKGNKENRSNLRLADMWRRQSF
jgi:hypothetical protein